MKNINGVKLNDSDIKNTIEIAKDLQYYGYSFNYFYENYTSLLTIANSKKLWNEAIELNTIAHNV